MLNAEKLLPPGTRAVIKPDVKPGGRCFGYNAGDVCTIISVHPEFQDLYLVNFDIPTAISTRQGFNVGVDEVMPLATGLFGEPYVGS